jgi:hypothetical protein
MQTSSNEIRVSRARVIRQPIDKEGLVATLFRPLTKALDFLEKHLEQDWRSRPRTSSNERV